MFSLLASKSAEALGPLLWRRAFKLPRALCPDLVCPEALLLLA